MRRPAYSCESADFNGRSISRSLENSLKDVEELPASSRKAAKWDVKSRWTPTLVEDGWTPITYSFLDCYGSLGITSGEAMFIIHLVRYKWDEKMPYPGFFTIAGKMKVTDISVRKYARDLERKGFLKRIGRLGKTTVFDLTPLFAALEKAIADKARLEGKAV